MEIKSTCLSLNRRHLLNKLMMQLPVNHVSWWRFQCFAMASPIAKYLSEPKKQLLVWSRDLIWGLCGVSVKALPKSVWALSKSSSFLIHQKNMAGGRFVMLNCPEVWMCLVPWDRLASHSGCIGTDSRSTVTPSKINHLLKMNEWNN